MKRYFLYTAILCISIIYLNCSNDDNPLNAPNSGSSDWLIPSDQIQDGGPGKDGIPALSNPSMIQASSVSFLGDDDLVIGIKMGDEVRVYPHRLLAWHEIINDGIGTNKYSITYCPLTGTSMAWNRILNSSETTFGVSGWLYNNNLIPYDRGSNSNWSQMKLKAVNGELMGFNVELFPIVETTWGFWKQLYPNSLVVSNNTNVYSSDQYTYYPYGDYRTNHNRLLFSVSNDDSRLPRKERIHGIIENEATQVFRFTSFPEVLTVHNINFSGKNIVVAGSQPNNFIVSFYRMLDGDDKVLDFSPINNNFPNILKDHEGNIWNIFGEAVEGPRKGSQLTATRSYNAYWFAWGTFWPNAEIFGQ